MSAPIRQGKRTRPIADGPLLNGPSGPFPALPKKPKQRTTATSQPASKELTPHEALGSEIGRMLSEKQKAYGDSFGRSGAVLRVLFPDGIPVEKFDDVLTLARILDKMFRIASAPLSGDAMGEDPYRDIAGYAILAEVRRKQNRRAFRASFDVDAAWVLGAAPIAPLAMALMKQKGRKS